MRRFLGAVRAGFTSTNLPLHIPSKSTARTLCFCKIRAGIGTSTEEKTKKQTKKRIKAQFVLFGTLLLECNSNPAHLVLTGAHLPAVAPRHFPNRPHSCFASIKQGNARRFRFKKNYESRFLSPPTHSKCRCQGKLHIFFERTVRRPSQRRRDVTLKTK